MDKSSLGDRMKQYEAVSKNKLIKRVPVIVRIDGKAFSSLTKKLGFKKSYNETFIDKMMKTAQAVMKEMQGCKFCYGQSDEISFLLTDYRTIGTQGWFDYGINKMVSISASVASVAMSSMIIDTEQCLRAYFDSRAFNVPKDEVVNYFIWRQQDATRNAIQMAGQEYFSHRALQKKSCNEIQEMLFQREGINFNDYSPLRKRGYCIIDGEADTFIPIFTKSRDYIENFINVRED